MFGHDLSGSEIHEEGAEYIINEGAITLLLHWWCAFIWIFFYIKNYFLSIIFWKGTMNSSSEQACQTSTVYGKISD